VGLGDLLEEGTTVNLLEGAFSMRGVDLSTVSAGLRAAPFSIAVASSGFIFSNKYT